MAKTALTQLWEFIDNSTSKDDITKKVANLMELERQQIIAAFDSGWVYGNGMTTFDYPAERYYSYTYRNKENETEEKIT